MSMTVNSGISNHLNGPSGIFKSQAELNACRNALQGASTVTHTHTGISSDRIGQGSTHQGVPPFFGCGMHTQDHMTMRTELSALWVLGMRLHMAKLYDKFENKIVAAHKFKDIIAIFMEAPNGEPLIVTDDLAMFPSDTLITKLRMMVA